MQKIFLSSMLIYKINKLKETQFFNLMKNFQILTNSSKFIKIQDHQFEK